MDFLKGIGGIYYLVGLLLAGLTIEIAFPWRKIESFTWLRWARNASMAVYSFLMLSFMPVLASFSAAVWAEGTQIGLFNLAAPALWLQIIFAIVILDLATYGAHRALHSWYLLWRSHRVHHSDRRLDATTSLRFHPFEAVFRAVIEVSVVVAVGLPPESILWIFALTTFVNTVTHLNIALPHRLEAPLSKVFVTPHLHKLHHAAAPGRMHTNFGVIFSVWDRLLNTYTPVSALAVDEPFGIEGDEQIEPESFANLALDPFRTPEKSSIPGEQSI